MDSIDLAGNDKNELSAQISNGLMELSRFQLYSGEGTPITQRGMTLPPFEKPVGFNDPAGYVADVGLRDAVNVALLLGQPLLLTGEPGTGKTQLAYSLAYELALPNPLVSHVKTTTTARDLFYRYDALSHFHDAQTGRDQVPSAEDYITYEALGKAILLANTHTKELELPSLPEFSHYTLPLRCVVLLDEIDKAPRDLPNDLLNEIDAMSFTVTETRRTFQADQSFRPILVLTSNSERNLPDAFLRRCVFYHIDFPNRPLLRQVVINRIGLSSTFTEEMLENALIVFEAIRAEGQQLKKKPGTAELLNWTQILAKLQIDVKNPKPGQEPALTFSGTALAKHKEDRDIVLRHLSRKE